MLGGVPAILVSANPDTYGYLPSVCVVKIPDARNPEYGIPPAEVSTVFTVGFKSVRRDANSCRLPCFKNPIIAAYEILRNLSVMDSVPTAMWGCWVETKLSNRSNVAELRLLIKSALAPSSSNSASRAVRSNS